MTVNLAALQGAAESLGHAARKADDGHAGEASFALIRAGLTARIAFGDDQASIEAFARLIAVVDGELPATATGSQIKEPSR